MADNSPILRVLIKMINFYYVRNVISTRMIMYCYLLRAVTFAREGEFILVSIFRYYI